MEKDSLSGTKGNSATTVHLRFCVGVLANANNVCKVNAASLDVEMARRREIPLMYNLHS